MANPTTHGQDGRRDGAPPEVPALRLDAAGVDSPVLLVEADTLLPGLLAVLRGWPVTVTPLRPDAIPDAPLSWVHGGSGGFSQGSIYLDRPHHGLGPAAAVCGVVADLAQRFLESRPDWLALHGAAFLCGGRVVALTGAARAGKSTLAARLSGEPGWRTVCDDVLPVAPDGNAFALGVGPRLRLPLPRAAASGFRAHVAATRVLADRRYAYLRPPGLLAHGSAGPVAAVILLDRREGAEASLREVDAADAVGLLLPRNMSSGGSVADRVDRVEALARGAVCLKLVYSDLEEAVALIRRGFPADGAWPAVTPLPALPAPTPEAVRQRPAPRPDRLLRQAEGTEARRVGDDLFLCRPDRDETVRLNALGGAVWRLLAESTAPKEVAAILCLAFPDAVPDRIAADVDRILADLAAAGLVRPDAIGVTTRRPRDPAVAQPLAQGGAIP